MSFNSSADIKDKFFSALVYLLPLYYGWQFSIFLVKLFPVLQFFAIPLIPIAIVYNSIPFADLIIFFVLFLAVVRNQKISHFIRFNTMQAMLIEFGLFLVSLIFDFLIKFLTIGLLVETVYNLLFLATLTACLYAIIQSILGRYAEIPAISEAAYYQVRW